MDGVISRSEALKQGLSAYFTGKPCVNGHITKRYVLNWTCYECHAIKSKVIKKEWVKRNPEKIKQYSAKYAKRHSETNKEWRKNNRERINEKQREWYSKNREKMCTIGKNWRKQNRDLMNDLKAQRRSDLLQRTPKWQTRDDRWMIREAYSLAKLRKQVTGIDWHVDHIIPLKGKKVSGLHVPQNIQVIPSQVNIRKGNKFSVG